MTILSILIFKEMDGAGLPAPEYNDNAFMLNVTIRNGELNGDNGEVNGDNGEVNGDNGEIDMINN